ncbi:flocculation protein FLO11 isoform X2 [Lucilia sericata]|uniref:flocculation protein FLO11 isoform X2 n=1 Tax=Lucilia sericata TaxID=13632 RepID=UPI0018A825BE|nr:flocculation protein FLO11 isoform X2 [Lucilia sericata]
MNPDSPLSSKVAMFNQHVNQHKQSQLLNPFSNPDGRSSPKPTFSKDEYGKPLAGSLTEMRGQKANIHVLKEMLELCQIIDSEGYDVKDEPSMRVIPFGELFNIYNYISDKVVGILLRARKHKLVEFEGEMLFQRRDDDVPIFLLKPIHEIRRDMESKIESIKRCGSPAPQATSVLLDKKAHGLDVPSPRSSVSRTPSPQSSKAGTPAREVKPKAAEAPAAAETPKIQVSEGTAEAAKTEVVENKVQENQNKPVEEVTAPTEAVATPQPTEVKEKTKPLEVETKATTLEVPANTVDTPTPATDNKTDVNNNNNNNDLPTIVIEATAVYQGPAKTVESTETAAPVTTPIISDSESNSAVSNAPSETVASA